MLDLITGAVIGWLVDRVADDSAAGLGRIFVGDRHAKVLRAVVMHAVEGVACDPSIADAGVLGAALLVESPALESPVPAVTGYGDVLDLPAVLRALIEPRLGALAEQGYTYDIDRIMDLLGRAIRKGIEADAVQDGPLKSLAEAMRAQDLLDELSNRRPTRHHAFDHTSTVSRLAPDALADRDVELTELTDFCTRPSAPPYSYWSGTAWAGKTALLATLVLTPLPEVMFVSFFIRAGDQDDYRQFLRTMTRQLAVILAEIPPPDPARDEFDSMLAAAAVRCEQQGRRLVLVVDGLDEDWRGTGRSIASLLPERPPAGMRVIVSGRPHPSGLDDLPDHHPLLDPRIVRTLTSSRHAQVSERQAKRDLMAMLDESLLSRLLLGLVVAAEAGLSIRCLKALTGKKDGWQIEKCLGAVSGRVLHRQDAGNGTAGGEDDEYVLAHQDLRELTKQLLGDELGKYRQRILIWAQEYRDMRWPSKTPAYLLSGYFRMLRKAGETSEMIACAVDAERHDRMLDMSGGEAAARDEITQAQEAVLATVIADTGTVGAAGTATSSRRGNETALRSLILLGMHHANLTWRNDNIPSNLPAVWARLGHPERAEALALSAASEHCKLLALAELAKAFGLAGDADRSGVLASAVLKLAATMTGESSPGFTLMAVARVLAAGGHPGPAEDIARLITHDAIRCEALADVTAGWSAQGYCARSFTVAREVQDLARQVIGSWEPDVRPTEAARILALAVTAWAGAGETSYARAIAQEIDGYLDGADIADDGGCLLSYASQAWAAAGEADRAHALALRLVAADLPIRYGHVGYAVAQAARAYARAGQVMRAEQIARTIPGIDPDDQAQTRLKVLCTVVSAWAESGDTGGAHAVAQQAEELARSITWPRDRANALTDAAHAWIDAGADARAEALAREAGGLARTVGDVPKQQLFAHPETDPGELTQVHAMMEALAASRDRPVAEMMVLRAAVPAAAMLGKASRAEMIAQHITHHPSRHWALAAAQRMTAWGALPELWELRLCAELSGVPESPWHNDPEHLLADAVLNGDPSAWMVEDRKWGLGGDGDTDADRASVFLLWLIGITLSLWSMQGTASRTRTGQGLLSIARQAEEFAETIRTHPASMIHPEIRQRLDNICSYAIPGHIDRGYALARAILTPDDRAWELGGAARAWTKRNYIYGADEFLIETLDAALQAQFLALAAYAWAHGGHGERASAAASKVERIARELEPSATAPSARTLLLAIAAEAWARADDCSQARNLASEAEDHARQLHDPTGSAEIHQAWSLGDAAMAWQVAGNPDRALTVAKAIADKKRQAAALARMACHADKARSTALLAQALRLSPDGWELAVHALTLAEPETLVAAAEALLHG